MKQSHVACLVILAILVSAPASADYLVKKHTVVAPVIVQGNTVSPGGELPVQIWISKNKMAIETGVRTVIYDKLKKKIYMVFPAKKQYVEMDIPIVLEKYLPVEMEQVLPNLTMSVKEVTELGETRQIGDWSCTARKVVLFNAVTTVEFLLWTTGDIPAEIGALTTKAERELVKISFPMSEDDFQRFSDIEGFPVLTEMTISSFANPEAPVVMKIRDELLEIHEEEAPEGTYTVPADFTKRDRLAMDEMS